MAVVRSEDYFEELREGRVEYRRVLAGSVAWVPIRVAVRLVAGLAWTLGACFISRLASVAGLFSAPLAKRWTKAVSRRWIGAMPAILGIRMTVIGRRPEKPYFLVVNHITWLDALSMYALCDVRSVVMAEMLTMPIMGTLFRGLDAIPTRRLPEDTPRCMAEMMATLRRGGNLLMAPEGNISPGREVRRFRPRLLEAAVRCSFPVHYASITYRTPKGSPPAAGRVLFGPDPNFPYPEGKIPEAEFEGWGTQRSFLSHLVRLLALPHSEIVVRFGREPIHGNNPVQLANELQQAVTRIFTPVQGHPAKTEPVAPSVRARFG